MGHVAVGKNVTVFSLALLIAGATIGAGVLGLPVQTGLSGFMPSTLGIVIVWIIMTFTAMVLANRFINSKSDASDYPTIFKEDFGSFGKWLAVLGYLVNYYGIMVAYLCGAGVILAYLIPINISQNWWILVFFVLTSILILYGLVLVVKANMVFMIILGVSFILLIILIAGKMQASSLIYTDWGFLIPAAPVIMTTFLFHNIIPPICRSLENNRKKIYLTIILGTSISCVIVLLWNFVSIGAVPMGGEGRGNLLYAYLHGEPATVPLAAGLHSTTITMCGMIFSICAILTSFISVAVGLRGFMRDLLKSTFKVDNKILTICLTLWPSLIVAIVYPSLFLSALDIAGGVGGVLIFGIFPAMLLIKYSKNKFSPKAILGIILFVFLGLLILLDIFQEFNIIHVKPSIEKQYPPHSISANADTKK